GRPPFTAEDVRLVESFAQQAGLGIELAESQDERAQFALLADRERIARDLHDHVIQRLFAVGMSLQAAAHSIHDQRTLDRIENSVEELDATIRDVRGTIFSLELQATRHLETSTRSRILDVASSAAPGLGFQPRLQFDGPIDTKVPEEMVPDMLAVVREALSNATRHARATTVEIHVEVDDEVVIVVTDDGRGAAERTRSSGLANMQARAEGRGGSMAVGGGHRGKGTSIEWRVPLEQ
ncbi:MAG: sensor histidine kinase, partial [Acidimicrobiales bacterium]